MFVGERKRVCDLCQSTDIGKEDAPRYPVMFYPFTDREMSELAEQFQQLFPMPQGMLGAIMPIAVPPFARFEFCRGCTDGFLPMLQRLREQAHARILEQMKARSGQSEPKQKRRAMDPEPDDE